MSLSRSWLALSLVGAVGSACGAAAEAEQGAPGSAAVAKKPATVGYDLRRLRPINEETLAAMFERLRKAAVAEGKFAAVLFSADWCEACRMLDMEFGNMHAAEAIGHVRIFEIKEEDWEAATRMNEVNELRAKWIPTINQYPILLVLDEHGDRIEEMKEAKERLEHAGQEPTLPTWFAALHR